MSSVAAATSTPRNPSKTTNTIIKVLGGVGILAYLIGLPLLFLDFHREYERNRNSYGAERTDYTLLIVACCLIGCAILIMFSLLPLDPPLP
jgi:cell division protein FtsX